MAKKNIYIAGKITGLNLKEVDKKFETASRHLFNQGYNPKNPRSLTQEPVKKYTWREWVQRGIEHLMKCDGIYLLNDWKDSKGAKLQKHIADELGLEIMYEN